MFYIVWIYQQGQQKRRERAPENTGSRCASALQSQGGCSAGCHSLKPPAHPALHTLCRLSSCPSPHQQPADQAHRAVPLLPGVWKGCSALRVSAHWVWVPRAQSLSCCSHKKRHLESPWVAYVTSKHTKRIKFLSLQRWLDLRCKPWHGGGVLQGLV